VPAAASYRKSVAATGHAASRHMDRPGRPENRYWTGGAAIMDAADAVMLSMPPRTSRHPAGSLADARAAVRGVSGLDI